jgi:two-component system cell cycle sensor histidine kinase PleC
VAALLALRPVPWPALVGAPGPTACLDAGPQLLAQMSLELRTPLNAMIGFSEVMLRELHGPLGHARYQEYAAYISESGGRLLKASEDTLAVTATMSALVAERRSVRHDRVLPATLLHEAWAAAADGEPRPDIRFTVLSCSSREVECDWRATVQALEHLLREAIARTPANGTVEARWRDDAGCLEIEVRPSRTSPAASLPEASPTEGHREHNFPAGGGLRVLLARSLLEMQSATLSLYTDGAGSWSAQVAFPTIRHGRMSDI